MSAVRLHLTATGIGCEVEVDGHRIDNAIRGVSLDAVAGHPPTLTLYPVLIGGADIDAEMRVKLPAATEEALIALGWTPPTA